MKLIDGDEIKFAAAVTAVDMCGNSKYSAFEKSLIVKLSDMVTRVAEACDPVDAIPINWILDQIEAEEDEGHRGSYSRLVQKWREHNPTL